MKFRKCAAAGALALCLAAAGPLSALAGQSAGPGAAYQPSVNGVNIYVSKMGNTLTLKLKCSLGSLRAHKKLGQEHGALLKSFSHTVQGRYHLTVDDI